MTQRLKSDEIVLLHALRANAACPGAIAEGRRLSIFATFERIGIVKDGQLTNKGQLVAKRYPETFTATAEPVQQSEAPPIVTTKKAKKKKKKSPKHEERPPDEPTVELDVYRLDETDVVIATDGTVGEEDLRSDFDQADGFEGGPV